MPTTALPLRSSLISCDKTSRRCWPQQGAFSARTRTDAERFRRHRSETPKLLKRPSRRWSVCSQHCYSVEVAERPSGRRNSPMGAEKYYKYAWICSSCGAKHNTRPDTCVRCNFDKLRKERYEVTASEYCGHINHLFQEGEFRDFRFAQFDQDEMCRVPER